MLDLWMSCHYLNTFNDILRTEKNHALEVVVLSDALIKKLDIIIVLENEKIFFRTKMRIKSLFIPYLFYIDI